ncbi:MAG: endolytic transglycosylase MltG [Acutalibacteraceae bacterium]|jgi:UPF0755 protein
MRSRKIWTGAVYVLLCVSVWLAGCANSSLPVASEQGVSSVGEPEPVSAGSSEEPVPASEASEAQSSAEPVPVSSQTAASATPSRQEPSSSRVMPVSSQAVPEPVSSQTPASSAVNREVSVTVPEGYTFMQIASLLEQKGVCSAKDFYRTCQSYTPKSFSISTSADRCFRMEGYLFPDTYTFYKNDNPQNVLIKMLNNYHAKVGNLSEDTLILASIIEREARSDEHMKLVSSVFRNRLNNAAEFPYLDADPTRDYVNQFITGNSLVASPAKYAALYNTCGKRKGLPAGPICCPGLRAINAAKNPTSSNYYYFFYGKDAQNHYSETLEEHEEQIKQYGVG